MAKIGIVIDFPTLTQGDLKELVRAHDAVGDHPIDLEHVRPEDVADIWFRGEFPNVPYTLVSEWL